MAKRSHSLVMADATTFPLTPPDPTINRKDSQSLSVLSSPTDNTELSRSKKQRHGPGGGSHQPMDWYPGQPWICNLTDIPIKSTSSVSGWSTLPQVQSVQDTSEEGMTLRLGVGPDSHRPPEYSHRRPTQDEMLVGCGAWQQEQLETEMVPSMPIEEALADEPPNSNRAKK